MIVSLGNSDDICVVFSDFYALFSTINLGGLRRRMADRWDHALVGNMRFYSGPSSCCHHLGPLKSRSNKAEQQLRNDMRRNG